MRSLSSSNLTYCFLDTNVLIHKQTFDEVDWPGIVGASDVCLVLAPIVVKELDRHKTENKNEWVQSRARTLLSKLKPYLRDPQIPAGQSLLIRPHVELRYLTREPMVDWTTLGLDAGWNDDRLIASILEFNQEYPDAAVVFAADDTSCLAKALAHGIRTVDVDGIPGQARTSLEAAENAKLRRQIQDLSNRVPRLQLCFLEGGQPMAIARRSRTAGTLPQEALDAFIAETLVREQQPLEVALAWGRKLLAAGQLKSSDLERYEQEYTRYLQLLPAWLPLKWSRERGPVVNLWFLVTNEGTQPASDVRLALTFPYGSFVAPLEEDPEVWDIVIMPERPEATWMKTQPTGARASQIALARSLAPSVPLHLLHPPTRPTERPRPTGPVLSLDTPERHKVSYAHPKLIQGGDWPMNPIRIYLPPSTSGAFQVGYWLRADELSAIDTGTLTVKFTPDGTTLSNTVVGL